MLKVGLVGTGGISGAHIPVWENMEDAELAAICDVRPELMEKYPNVRHYTDYDEMLREEGLDIVDICLPTFLHAEFALKALEKGIHVLTEKPISLVYEDVQRIYQAAQAHNVTFMVAQVLRFWPEYCYLKEVCDSGKYGKVLSGAMERLGNFPNWTWDNWMQDPRRSGLVPYDLHIHDLDFLVYAFGAPKKVHSFRKQCTNQDYIHQVYEFDGFTVSADSAWYRAAYPFRSGYRFQFEEAVLEFRDNVLSVYLPDGTVLKPLAQDDQGSDTHTLDLPTTNAYANEIRYFVDCVKAHRPADRIQPRELETVISILNSI